MDPTYHGYVATTDDALLLFEACRLGILERRKRRLSDSERRCIAPGHVFVWDETESGIRRWTDGRRWSPSRVNGCFLVYSELEPRSDQQQRLPESKQSDVPLESGLTKRTLSLFTTQNSKLHLVCYFRKSDLGGVRATTPSQDPYLRGITIPRSLYPEILPEMPQPPAAPHARKRRLSIAPVTIMVRGCTSMQPVQCSNSPLAHRAPLGAADQCASPYAYHPAAAAAAAAHGPPVPVASAIPAHVSRRRRNSTASDYYMYTTLHRTCAGHAAQPPAAPGAAGELPPPCPMQYHHGPGVGGAAAGWHPQAAGTVPMAGCPCNSSSGSGDNGVGSPHAHTTPLLASPHGWASAASTRRSSTLVGSDGCGEGRVQLPPISELLKSIDRPPPLPVTSPPTPSAAPTQKLTSLQSYLPAESLWTQRQPRSDIASFAI
ncbi:Gluconate transport-inducing protein [Coemansia javaensis]|uniref:Gluconate transport-inducing protein n=1 Tax=Coemansia javaensis TaxID=2761396 RepID=A0A9W8HDP1_9FUNG|nr:Gluconate transport-inducing protein [Coemansia javaensis]